MATVAASPSYTTTGPERTGPGRPTPLRRGRAERRERRCEALKVLQRHVQESPVSAKEASLQVQMTELERAGNCAQAVESQPAP